MIAVVASLDDVRAAAPMFFATDVMTFFDSRACEKVYPLPAAHKTLFITSELLAPEKARIYSVRVIDWDTKDLTTLGEFGAFETMRQAREFCEWMVMGCGWLPNDMRLGGKGTKAWRDEAGVLHVQYYDTEIVTADPDGKVVLNTGGFFTMTTKTRMTQASNQFSLGYVVKTRGGKWYAFRNGREYEFNKKGKCVIQ